MLFPPIVSAHLLKDLTNISTVDNLHSSQHNHLRVETSPNRHTDYSNLPMAPTEASMTLFRNVDAIVMVFDASDDTSIDILMTHQPYIYNYLGDNPNRFPLYIVGMFTSFLNIW